MRISDWSSDVCSSDLVSALAQYIQHRKIILEFLERAINVREGEKNFPLEKVVHQLVFPMQHTSDEIEYSQQNLWMIDERLTFHSFISSDKRKQSLRSEERRVGNTCVSTGRSRW